MSIDQTVQPLTEVKVSRSGTHKPSVRKQKSLNIWQANSAMPVDDFLVAVKEILPVFAAAWAQGVEPCWSSFDDGRNRAMVAANRYIQSKPGLLLMMRHVGAKVLLDSSNRVFRDPTALPEKWAIIWPLADDRKHSLAYKYDIDMLAGVAVEQCCDTSTYAINEHMFFAATSRAAKTVVIIKDTVCAAAIRNLTDAAVVVRLKPRNLQQISSDALVRLGIDFERIIFAGSQTDQEFILAGAQAAMLELGKKVVIATAIAPSGKTWAEIISESNTKTSAEGIWDTAVAVPVINDGKASVGISALAWFTDYFDRDVYNGSATSDDPEKPNIRPEEVLAGINFLKAKEHLDDVSANLARDMRLRLTAGTILERVGHKAKNKPILYVNTPGLGKTDSAINAMAQMTEPSIILTPRIVDAEAIYLKIISRNPSLKSQVHMHMPRGKKISIGKEDRACLRYEELIKPLEEPARTPAAWACQTCEHGKQDGERDPKVPACQYMVQLRASKSKQIVIATHAAAADASSLLEYTKRPVPVRKDGYIIRHDHAADGDDKVVDRFMIIDEAPELDRKISVSLENVAAALQMVEHAEHDLMTLEDKANKFENSKLGRLRKRNQKLDFEDEDGLADSYNWLEKTQAILKRLSNTLGNADPRRDYRFNPAEWQDLITLTADMPALVNRFDGTIVEDVRIARRADLATPSSWLKGLAKAIKNDTAWVSGGCIVGGYPTFLWTRYLERGGWNLNATPTIRELSDVENAGGEIVNQYRVPEHLYITQRGPVLFGKGSLEKQDKILVHVEKLVEIIKGCQARGETFAIITHMKLAEALKQHEYIRNKNHIVASIGHWGKSEKAHNQWESTGEITFRKRLILYGLPIPAPRQQQIDYALERAAIGGQIWDGSTEKGCRISIRDQAGLKIDIVSAARMPADPFVRSWLIDRITADVVQAIGRLRGCRASEVLHVDIYGAIGLAGHGMMIPRFVELEGRTANSRRRLIAIAEVVAAKESDISRRGVSKVLRENGVKVDDHVIIEAINWIKQQALRSGETIEQVAIRVASESLDLISKHGADAALDRLYDDSFMDQEEDDAAEVDFEAAATCLLLESEQARLTAEELGLVLMTAGA